MIIKAAGTLALVALIGTTALVAMHDLTRERIIVQQRRAVLANLNQIIPQASYDNAMHEDYIDLQPSGLIHPRQPIRIYRARVGETNIGLIMQVTAPDGYNGDIKMLVGMMMQSSLQVGSGVRCQPHLQLKLIQYLLKILLVIVFAYKSYLESPKRFIMLNSI